MIVQNPWRENILLSVNPGLRRDVHHQARAVVPRRSKQQRRLVLGLQQLRGRQTADPSADPAAAEPAAGPGPTAAAAASGGLATRQVAAGGPASQGKF